jgi:hypothetical protein
VSAATPRLLDVIAAIGLALGGVCGLAGTVIDRAELRQALWGLDGVGLVVATALLWGEPLLPTSAPLPSLGYPFLQEFPDRVPLAATGTKADKGRETRLRILPGRLHMDQSRQTAGSG